MGNKVISDSSLFTSIMIKNTILKLYGYPANWDKKPKTRNTSRKGRNVMEVPNFQCPSILYSIFKGKLYEKCSFYMII